MYVNVAKLKGMTVEKGFTGESLSRLLNISPSTYYRKLNKDDGRSLTLNQIFTLSSILSLSKQEAIEIFLAEDSHKRE